MIDNPFINLILPAIILILILSGIYCPVYIVNDSKEINRRAIEMERAYYDTKTGKFMWSDNVFQYIYTGVK